MQPTGTKCAPCERCRPFVESDNSIVLCLELIPCKRFMNNLKQSAERVAINSELSRGFRDCNTRMWWGSTKGSSEVGFSPRSGISGISEELQRMIALQLISAPCGQKVIRL